MANGTDQQRGGQQPFQLDFDPSQFFGPRGNELFDPAFGGTPKTAGWGAYGLPAAFTYWSAPARYAFPAASQFLQGSQPIVDYFSQELGKNYEQDLFNRARTQVDVGVQEGRRAREQAFTRGGQGGGTGISPLAGQMLQQEQLARSGALGLASQQAVFQAQQMKTEAARNLQNVLSQQLQALLTPAQIEAARSAQVPIGQVGPGLLGPALGALGGLFGGLTG